MGVIEKMGPEGRELTGTAKSLKVGQRVVAVPWPSAEGEGTWQEYVSVPVKNLVTLSLVVLLCDDAATTTELV
jgi:NADPH:quinone reductase-like Zn-dependent oxidoreductase